MTSLETGSYSLLAIAFAIVSIAAFVLYKNPRQKPNQAFSIFALGAGLWVSGIALLSITHDFAFDKLVNSGGLLFFLGFFLLAQEFPSPARIKASPVLIYAPLVAMAAVIPWNLVNSGMTVHPDGSITPIPGPLVIPYMLVISAYVIAGVAIIIRSYRKSRGKARLQLLYLFLGTGIFMISSVVFDALLPAFGVTSFIMLGPVSALAFMGFVAYAIVRHELLDIRIVIQRGLIYSVLIVAIVALYLIAMAATGLLFDRSSDAAYVATGIATTILGIMGVPVIERRFRKATDRIFFKDRYDYAEALRALSEILYTETELDRLVSRTERALEEIFRAESSRIHIPRDGSGVLIQHEKQGRAPSISIPIMLDHAQIGSITVGKKRSGDPYGAEDRKLLETFAYQAATALSRARLYSEVKRHAEELEERVRERTEELRRARDAERRILVDISHGLQTPLAVFKLKLEDLRSQFPEGLGELERSLETLSAFIYDLLRLAEIERKQDPSLCEIDLSRLVKEIAEEIEVIAESRGISLSCAAEDGIAVIGDERRLREAIMNIAGNSVKYMKAEGKREIAIALSKDGSNALISLADTGIGIRKGDLARIFDRFYRTEEAAQAARGNGLGLTIAQRIIERHKGSIEVKSETGKGTEVTIRLPLDRLK